ncbi:rod shape-determining protein MreC [Thioalkalivibrio sp. ALgr1]|uniref:rod shape-determining protein MreC n=1 Tax=unclassified Thioalkalivibrio TaxID=2621013 RepID=UPI0012DFC301|nr:rod shape-determining protein MreC [Thioalkalivibrio sp. ALgr1]
MSKPLFRLGVSPTLRLLAVILLGVALMALDHRLNELQTVRNALSTVAYPLQVAVDAPIRAGSRLLESFTSREDLITENRILREENAELRARQLRFDALQMENDRLRALLNTAERAQERVEIAKLLAVDLDPFRQQIVLSKGNRHGVYPGQPVIHPDGVIGQVLSTQMTSSTALLISDPGHALPVLSARTGLRGIVVGTGNPRRLEMRHVPPQEDIEEGDLLLTSGLGGRFPPDYPVARVTSVERQPGQPFLDIQAEPLAALDRSREVLLLWTSERPDADADTRPEEEGETTEREAEPEGEADIPGAAENP